MSELHLHLDADVSARSLHDALRKWGHDVTRTRCEWMPEDASEERQLLGATAHGRAIFTFNVRDFALLAQRFPNHHGVILAHQNEWTLSALIRALHRLLTETDSDEWQGQVHWLNDWREPT